MPQVGCAADPDLCLAVQSWAPDKQRRIPHVLGLLACHSELCAAEEVLGLLACHSSELRAAKSLMTLSLPNLSAFLFLHANVLAKHSAHLSVCALLSEDWTHLRCRPPHLSLLLWSRHPAHD